MEQRQGQAKVRGQFKAARIPTPTGIPEHERTPDPIAARPTNADRLAGILDRLGYGDAVKARKWGRDVTRRELRLRDPDNIDLSDGADDDTITIGSAPYVIEQRGSRTIIRVTEAALVLSDDGEADANPYDPFEYVGIGDSMSAALTDLEAQIDAREKGGDDGR